MCYSVSCRVWCRGRCLTQALHSLSLVSVLRCVCVGTRTMTSLSWRGSLSEVTPCWPAQRLPLLKRVILLFHHHLASSWTFVRRTGTVYTDYGLRPALMLPLLETLRLRDTLSRPHTFLESRPRFWLLKLLPFCVLALVSLDRCFSDSLSSLPTTRNKRKKKETRRKHSLVTFGKTRAR